MFTNPAGYDRLMGRWSRRLADPFIDFSGIGDGERVLDVGSGTGSLADAIVARFERCEVVAVEPVEAYVEYARARIVSPRCRFEIGAACALPFDAASFDSALALLVIGLISPPERAVAEMRRVTRPGGTVAACGWDFGSGLAISGPLWDAIVAVIPAMETRHSRHSALGRHGEHAALWTGCGLGDVREDEIFLKMEFQSLDDFWLPFLSSSTPSSAAIATLSADQRSDVKQGVRRRLLGGRADGPFTFVSRAFAVRGIVPAA